MIFESVNIDLFWRDGLHLRTLKHGYTHFFRETYVDKIFMHDTFIGDLLLECILVNHIDYIRIRIPTFPYRSMTYKFDMGTEILIRFGSGNIFCTQTSKKEEKIKWFQFGTLDIMTRGVVI